MRTLNRKDMRYSILVFLLLLSCLCFTAKAIFPELRLKHYTVEDGLSVNTISCITQDRKGFIWIGTGNGLTRFDGLRFKLFQPPHSDFFKLGNSINSITETKNGLLWLGTNDGVVVFDPQDESFSLFEGQTKDGVLIQSRIFDITRDQQDKLWIATLGQGSFVYDAEIESLIQFSSENSDSSLSTKVRSVFVDSRGIIWMLTYDKGLFSYNPITKEMNNYIGYGLDESERYDVMFEDSYGELWLGNYSYGLSKLNYQTGDFMHYLTPKESISVLHVRSIIEYAPGTLLLASDDGLTFFNTKTKEYKTIKSSPYILSGLNDDYVHALYKDREGGLWIGTYFGGINYSSPAFSNFEHFCSTSDIYFPGRIVSVMEEDPKGNLWIGTDDAGVFYFDLHNYSYKHYMPQRNHNSLTYHNIHALLYDEEKLWIGTYSGGIDCLDLKTGVFKNYKNDGKPGSLLTNSVYALYRDRRGDIWVGTPWGINIYDRKNDTFIAIDEYKMIDVSQFLEDNRGNLWIATLNKGLLKYNYTTKKWRQYLLDEMDDKTISSNSISTLCMDDNNNLWIGTNGGGICLYDASKDYFKQFEEFPADITCKIIYDEGFLWISTNKGIIRSLPNEGLYKTYNQSDGLQGIQFNPNSGIKASNGNIYFGGINGFNGFNPKSIQENTYVPSVFITNFQLFDKDVSCNEENSPLENSIIYTSDITLSHNQSMLTFEFVALSFMAPEKNHYSYILDGFEKEWRQISGSQPKASYTNLPPGEYIFKVRASNNDLLWNDRTTEVKVKILPPFWKTTYAYIIYILILGSSLTYFLRNYKKKVAKKYADDLTRVSVEKEKELYNTKINFFTQIVHEIRTPLSLIKGPLESVLKSNKRVNDVRDDLIMIERNTNRLLNLVNQLMDFRKLESGGISVKFAKEDVVIIINQVYERFRLSAEQKSIELLFEKSIESYIVYTDREALTKITSNLLTNGLKHAKTKILLQLILNEETNQIILQVSDDGSGVPVSEREKIFKAFYQVKDSKYTDKIGTGIGLPLAKSLVELLQGNIKIEDSDLGGALFIVELPIPPNRITDNIVASESKENIAISEEKIELDKLEEEKIESIPHILVVDDNEDLRNFISNQLNPYYHIKTADDGQTALRLVEQEQFDLVASDVMMPIMNGFEFCNLLKTNIDTSHIPVILLTAKVNVEAKIEGLENGADAYIEKPFSIEHLRAQINSLLSNREKLKKKFATTPSVSAITIATSKADALFIQKVEKFIEDNMSDTDFVIGDMAKELGMSRSAFFAKLRAVSGLTPNDYIRVSRLKKAVELFNEGETRVNEVCYSIGFSSPSYFSKCFHEQFGELPTAYIKNLHSKK